MMYASLLPLVMVMSMKQTLAVIIGDTYAQGEEFTMCINITDYQTMTLNDDITLVERESGGCCPAGTTSGHQFYTEYLGGQVVCGFESDGSYATSTSLSGGARTCVLNTCYVFKQNVECSTGTQLLNGCCGATRGSRTFGTDCEDYEYDYDTGYDQDIDYCLTYHTDYGTLGNEGTSAADDDQAEGSLVVDNVYTYAACAGDAGGSGSGAAGPNTSGAFSQAIMTYVGMLMPLFAWMSAA